MDLHQKHLYINRELSAISFNKRVLEQAMDTGVPLLSRLMFLSIVSSNLDEFFEVRVAGVKERSLLDLPVRGSDAMHPKELLQQIAKEVHNLIDEQYKVLNEKLLPELSREGIHLLRRTHLTNAQRKWVRNYFIEQVEPVLTPLGLDPAHPFPNVQNKSLNFLFDNDRTLSNLQHDLIGPVHGFFGRPRRRSDFDQWNQMRRIGWMNHHDSFTTPKIFGKF